MINDLKFSGINPVVINYNGSVDDIYAPVKTSSCDVNIVSAKILDDLYSSKKDGVYMKVSKKVPHKEKVIRFLNKGSASSTNSGDVNDNYTKTGSWMFYTDVNGDFRFTGTLLQAGNTFYMNLRHLLGRLHFNENNYWKLEEGEYYFYDSLGNSYKTWEDIEDDDYKVAKWNGDGWNAGTTYYYSDGSSNFICRYSNDNVVHYIDGATELIFGHGRYTWDATNMKWVATSQYTISSGGSFYATYGHWYLKVKDKDGNLVDAIMVNNVNTTEQTHTEWIMSMDRVNNTLTCLIPITEGTKDMTRVFTGDNGDVYYLDSNGDIYYWSWDVEKWVQWITITGDITTQDSFLLDYVIPDTNKNIIIKYDDDKFLNLNHLVPPVCYEQEITDYSRYDDLSIWEGYKMPNTYSQDVTLNLDEINMTCIDPLALMKYVTIDKILTKPAMMTYRDVIGTSLAYVKLNSNTLKVERNITYGSATHTTTNNILNMMCQISNFWDEGGEPASLYDVIQELLRPFCLTIEYVDDTYWIFNQTRTSENSAYDEYTIESNGDLTFVDNNVIEPITYDLSNDDWKSNNTENASIEIGSIYSKISAVASTAIPKYSNMVTDKVDYSQRDKYDIGQLNVQRNKSKGYRYMTVSGSASQQLVLDDADHWFYLWNGVYTDSDYELISYSMLVNGWLNINKAYEYLNGTSGYPNDYGNILNFYGGGNNPTATGKTQANDKPVEIKSRITAYAPDNGVPPEFLESADLMWNFISNEGQITTSVSPLLNKTNKTSSTYGSSISPSGTHRVVYHQKYEETQLNGLNSQTVDIRLNQSYSRTGIAVPVDVLNNNYSQNNLFKLITVPYPEYGEQFKPIIESSDVCYYPKPWNYDSVYVDNVYFNRYSTGYRDRIAPVWDRRRIDIYIDLGSSVLQFNGKEWVESSYFSESNSFYLLKLMNYEQLYHKDFSYNVIETSDYDPNNPTAGGHYSLTDDNYTYELDNHGGIVKNSTSGNYYCPPYKADDNTWSQWINECGEGYLSIVLPVVDGGTADVIVNITSSSLLGSTGGSVVYDPTFCPVYYEYKGIGEYYNPSTGTTTTYNLTPELIGGWYDRIGSTLDYSIYSGAKIDFLPPNVSHIKAEHLDLNISLGVPESNLGQMFSQSDIKYIIDDNSNYIEEYEMPEFKENTYHPLVNDSFSYLLFEGQRAYPDEFVINNLAVRPECYTVQAYMNWLSKIRKSYKKTLIPLKNATRPFNNFKNFIKSSEVGSNKLMVVSDSWDLKSNRHSISSIESQDLDVTTVQSYNVLELPRKARNERWNLPTAKKS